VADELDRWAARRAPELLARAEAEAVAQLREALVRAATAEPRRRADPPPAPPPAPVETGHALWAYCVTRSGAPLEDLPPGVDSEHPVEAIAWGDLVLYVSRVALAEYGAESLSANLNDFGWLERVARAHEAVLEHALRATTIVPLRLCTIYADADRARAMLAERAPELGASLAALDGREEWSVKLLVDPDALLAVAAKGRDPSHAGPAESGAAYLLQRRAEREDRSAAEQLAAGLADDVHARLQDWADDAVLSAPQNRELSGYDGDMLLNGAYLVERGRVQGMRDLVEELGEQHRHLGARLLFSGPFPPYNFAAVSGS
jgi:hypothetical protein